jgi:uncharacterized protein (TIGR02147 family)
MKPDVFEYDQSHRFLLDSVEYLQKHSPGFSIRKWASDMGMHSHSLVVMILQKKRNLTLKQVPAFSKGLKLSTPERMYFQGLVQLDSARSPEERDLCRLWLSDLLPSSSKKIREVDEYLVISHWLHMAILALSETKGFTGRPEEIAEKFGSKTNLSEVRSAIARLLDLGLLKHENGRLVCTYQRVTTRDDVSVRGAVEYHRQVARLADESLPEQGLLEREFQSFSVSVKSDRIPLAKEMIRKFRTQFYEAMTSGGEGDVVYQTNLHFFRLTESPSEMVPIVDEGAGLKPRVKRERFLEV